MKPLDNLKILDLSSGLTVSLATMYMVNFGAEVVKIEGPNGDKARKWFPKKEEDSLYFNYLNSGKKSVSLDITTEEGMAVLKQLVPMYDIVCTSGNPAELEALGIDYASIKAIKEDVIYGVVSPFGMTGPNRNKPASNLTVQALGVAMDMSGFPGDYPVSNQTTFMDHYAAGYLTAGILMAAIEKFNSGAGQMIDISLQDAIFACIESAPAAYSTIGEVQSRKGNGDPTGAPYDTLKTADGYVALGVSSEAQWHNFCDAMGLDGVADDPRFNDAPVRCANYQEHLKPMLNELLATMSKFDVELKCREAGVPACAVLTVDDVLKLPVIDDNHIMSTKVSEKMGEIQFPSFFFNMEKTPAAVYPDAPELGADNDTVLGQIK